MPAFRLTLTFFTATADLPICLDLGCSFVGLSIHTNSHVPNTFHWVFCGAFQKFGYVSVPAMNFLASGSHLFAILALWLCFLFAVSRRSSCDG